MGSGFNLFKNYIDITPPQVEQWVPMDVTGLVPPEATGVILRLANQWYKSIASVRKAGSTDDFSSYCQLANKNHTYAFCGLEDFTFEAYCKNDAYYNYPVNPIKIYLCGYTDESVVFLDNVVDAGVFSGDWSTFDASPHISPDATGGIFLVYNDHETTGHQFSIRGLGSTDEHHTGAEWGWHATHLALGGEASNFCYPIVALGDGKVQVIDKTSSGCIKVKLIGYTRPPVTFFLNSVLKTVTTRWAWQRVGVPEVPSDADGVIVELRNIAPGGKALAIREAGSADSDIKHSRLGSETAFWGACGLSDGEFEAYASWSAKAKFFVHGYTKPAGAPPPEEFQCPYCELIFSTQAELDAHIAETHPPVQDTITITAGRLEGSATIKDGNISMDITSGHIEGVME